jgi:hypothetical protein
MGLNAQTTVPTFTAGQVLTADQQNQSARTGVPVFATTVERDAAFGGSGEKTLAEGQLAYIEASNVVQYYDGAAWATLGPTSSGLTLITSTTIGSAVSSVTVTGAFSATYDNYLITVSGGVGSTAQGINLQLGSTTTGYYEGGWNVFFSTGSTFASNTNNGSSFSCGLSTTDNNGVFLFVRQPNMAKPTIFFAFGNEVRTAGGSAKFAAGFESSTTQHTAFTLSVAGTMTGGTIKVYGLQN